MTKEVPILPPDSLVQDVCTPMNKNNTPRELGESHVHNYKCIEKYQESMQSLRDWKIQKQQLYRDKGK